MLTLQICCDYHLLSPRIHLDSNLFLLGCSAVLRRSRHPLPYVRILDHHPLHRLLRSWTPFPRKVLPSVLLPIGQRHCARSCKSKITLRELTCKWVEGSLKVQLGLRPSPSDGPVENPMLIEHVDGSDHFKGDMRGFYEPAGLQSPQRTGTHSPAGSEDLDGHLHPFSYPPNAHTSPRNSLVAQSRNSPGPSRRTSYISSPLVADSPSSDNQPPPTPMSLYSYTSPSALSPSSPPHAGPAVNSIPPPRQLQSQQSGTSSPPTSQSQVTSPWEQLSPASQPAQLQPTYSTHGFPQASTPDEPAWEVVNESGWSNEPSTNPRQRSHDPANYGQAF
jgi:hypothetical protein